MGKLHVKLGSRKRGFAWGTVRNAATQCSIRGRSLTRFITSTDAASPPVAPFWCQLTVIWVCRVEQEDTESEGAARVWGCRRVKKDDSWGGREERGRDFCPGAAIVLNSTHMPTSVFNPLLSARDCTSHTNQPLCSPVNIWETMQRRMVEANIPVLGKIQSRHH